MSHDNEDDRKNDEEQPQQSVTPAQPGPGVSPVTAPQPAQPASAFVQPAQTIPDGDPRFAIRDAGTPYVVGLGHVGVNPAQYRNDQDKAEKDKSKAEKDKAHNEAETERHEHDTDTDTDTEEQNR